MQICPNNTSVSQPVAMQLSSQSVLSHPATATDIRREILDLSTHCSWAHQLTWCCSCLASSAPLSHTANHPNYPHTFQPCWIVLTSEKVQTWTISSHDNSSERLCNMLKSYKTATKWRLLQWDCFSVTVGVGGVWNLVKSQQHKISNPAHAGALSAQTL